jgi:hypothetical protein
VIREGGGCKKKLVDSCRGKEEFYEKKKMDGVWISDFLDAYFVFGKRGFGI